MRAQLRDHQIDHVVLERDGFAARWRGARWDSLVINGPVWHDRFPERSKYAVWLSAIPAVRPSLVHADEPIY